MAITGKENVTLNLLRMQRFNQGFISKHWLFAFSAELHCAFFHKLIQSPFSQIKWRISCVINVRASQEHNQKKKTSVLFCLVLQCAILYMHRTQRAKLNINILFWPGIQFSAWLGEIMTDLFFFSLSEVMQNFEKPERRFHGLLRQPSDYKSALLKSSSEQVLQMERSVGKSYLIWLKMREFNTNLRRLFNTLRLASLKSLLELQML